MMVMVMVYCCSWRTDVCMYVYMYVHETDASGAISLPNSPALTDQPMFRSILVKIFCTLLGGWYYSPAITFPQLALYGLPACP